MHGNETLPTRDTVQQRLKVRIFGLSIDALTRQDAVRNIVSLVENYKQKRIAPPCKYIVTPNVDHLVLLNESESFRAAYTGASMVLVDGRPILLASRLLRRPLPETVTGSDLVPAIFDWYQRAGLPLRIFLLGAPPGVAELAGHSITNKWPNLTIAGFYSPPLGFERDASECHTICDLVNRSMCDLLVLGLGAPKQELWIHAHADRLNVPLAVCAGATIDFLAGRVRRAPEWIRALSLEWLFRLALEPRRLFRRYARDLIYFPVYVWKEFRCPS